MSKSACPQPAHSTRARAPAVGALFLRLLDAVVARAVARARRARRAATIDAGLVAVHRAVVTRADARALLCARSAAIDAELALILHRVVARRRRRRRRRRRVAAASRHAGAISAADPRRRAALRQTDVAVGARGVVGLVALVRIALTRVSFVILSMHAHTQQQQPTIPCRR